MWGGVFNIFPDRVGDGLITPPCPRKIRTPPVGFRKGFQWDVQAPRGVGGDGGILCRYPIRTIPSQVRGLYFAIAPPPPDNSNNSYLGMRKS